MARRGRYTSRPSPIRDGTAGPTTAGGALARPSRSFSRPPFAADPSALSAATRWCRRTAAASRGSATGLVGRATRSARPGPADVPRPGCRVCQGPVAIAPRTTAGTAASPTKASGASDPGGDAGDRSVRSPPTRPPSCTHASTAAIGTSKEDPSAARSCSTVAGSATATARRTGRVAIIRGSFAGGAAGFPFGHPGCPRGPHGCTPTQRRPSTGHDARAAATRPTRPGSPLSNSYTSRRPGSCATPVVASPRCRTTLSRTCRLCS